MKIINKSLKTDWKKREPLTIVNQRILVSSKNRKYAEKYGFKKLIIIFLEIRVSSSNGVLYMIPITGIMSAAAIIFTSFILLADLYLPQYFCNKSFQVQSNYYFEL
ncbi:MAG: hypothetical protein ACTSSP_03230 [Candidatus Asgardarchaeia archaeon]